MQLSTARLPALPVEVWVDADGRPARVRDEAAVPSLRAAADHDDDRGCGEPVDVTP